MVFLEELLMFFIVQTILLTVISIYSIQKMTRNNQKFGNKTEVDRRFKAKKERNRFLQKKVLQNKGYAFTGFYVTQQY